MAEGEPQREPQINPLNPERYPDAEAQLGGADSIEKTTYIGNMHGAEPGDARWQHEHVTATVGGGGTTIVVWIAIVLAALAAVAYAVGLFR